MSAMLRAPLEDPGAISPHDPFAIDFELPPDLEAHEPPEARGMRRDDVRLMVSYIGDDTIIHSRFRDLPNVLGAGDLLLINTSGTMNAALPVVRADGTRLFVHLSTRLVSGLWTVELRRPAERGSAPFLKGRAGERLGLPDGGTLTLLTPHAGPTRLGGTKSYAHDDNETGHRLWIASLEIPTSVDDYLAEHGSPIRYHYVDRQWPSPYYQTVYATEYGSAEMPSAGRAFTPELITRLVAAGVQIAPLLLHTGVASLEAHEPPYEEFYRIPTETASLVNLARAGGRRIIAVGTTAVRAIETVTDDKGTTHPGQGWTELVITPEQGMRTVTGMLTGLHEPRASHLAMLAALAGQEHVRLAYDEALRERYLWHEFGDLHLILPGSAT